MSFNTMPLAALLAAAKADGSFRVESLPPSFVCVVYRQPLTTADGDLPGDVVVKVTLPLTGTADVLMEPSSITLDAQGGPVAARLVEADRDRLVAEVHAVIEAIVLAYPGGPARA